MNDFQMQTGRYQGGFRNSACAMRKNSVRQHEFAMLLRLLSSRFRTGSAERRILRQASSTAQCKENKLRKLLLNLGWSARVKRPRTLRFLICFQLTKLAPIPVAILWLILMTAKPVRARLLDPFFPWNSNQSVKSWTDSFSHRNEAKRGLPHSN